MNYLEICQRLQREAVFPGPDMTGVAGQTGEYLKIARWVANAWREIQVERPWNFRWAPFSVTLPAGSSVYDVRSLIGSAALESIITTEPLVLTKQSSGQKRRMSLLDFRLFQDHYAELVDNPGWPTDITFRPDGQVQFNRSLDEDYTLTGSYLKAPQELLLNTDIPQMPVQFHDAILYRALKKYAEFEEAGTLFQTASYNDSMWSDRMIRTLLPKILLGDTALA